MSDIYVHTVAMMGTVVTIRVVGHGADPLARTERGHAVERAVEWFREIERRCSRFEATSEIRELTTRIGTPIRPSEIVFEAVQFAVALADETDGAFDPTVGHRMEARGFDREYRSGRAVRSGIDAPDDVSYRDVSVDPAERTITVFRPLVLDLGAVAKGLAVDMAARELAPFENYAIDAGGDLYLAGRNPDREPWSVGIRHPREADQLYETIRASDAAVCTSGDYERTSEDGAHHILDPRARNAASMLASVTVIAPTALVADALSTAAFVLGPIEGRALLERQGVEGLLVTPTLERFETAGYGTRVESAA